MTRQDAIDIREGRSSITMKELIPCPFCGYDVMSVTHGKLKYDYYLVKCNNCGARTRKYKTAEKAITAWNKRQER